MVPMVLIISVIFFSPNFEEDGCLQNSTIAAAMTAINSQITMLAPVLNSPTVLNAVSVTSSNSSVPVDFIVKVYNNISYIFAVAMRDSSTTATFTLSGVSNAVVTVISESRTIPMKGSSFTDNFSGYEVHLYQVNGKVAKL